MPSVPEGRHYGEIIDDVAYPPDYEAATERIPPHDGAFEPLSREQIVASWG